MRFGGADGPVCEGYEIHMGKTVHADGQGSPLNYPLTPGEAPDGYRISSTCWGTYLHGLLDNPSVVKEVLGIDIPDYRAFKERQYDRLAGHIRQHIDLRYIYQQLGRPL
jgi:adenosylcobyric acid synthase